MKEQLELRGIRTDVFDSSLPNQFILCMWTSKRRRHLTNRSGEYDAVVVLGCDAAVDTARQAVEPTGGRVISPMDVRGIMNVVPSLHRPFDIRLKVQSVARTLGSSPDQPPM